MERLRYQSPSCPLILPYHIEPGPQAREDRPWQCEGHRHHRAAELARLTKTKVSRRGIRFGELRVSAGGRYKERLREVMEYHNFMPWSNYYKVDAVDYQQVLDDESLRAKLRLWFPAIE